MSQAKTTPFRIVIAGAGYAGLHIALRVGARLASYPRVDLTLVDRHDYHQLLTELPRVASGARDEADVRVSLQRVLPAGTRFVQTTITGFDLPGRELHAEAGAYQFDRMVLALGSRPNDFDIPGLAEQTLYLWSADDARVVWDRVLQTVAKAAEAADQNERARLLTIVIGGGGATGVELAGALAEALPELIRDRGISGTSGRVILVEAGHTILAGSSPELIAKARNILERLGVEVRTNARIAVATSQGFELRGGASIAGGVFIWAGGIKAAEVVAGSGLQVGYNGRVKVDRYLRALDHPEIYVAGDLASVVDPASGMALAPLAQTALEEGESVAQNLLAEIEDKPPRPFTFHDKGFVVSVGERRGVADIAGITVSGRLAHTLKDAIEWEYRNSVKHLRGWSPV